MRVSRYCAISEKSAYVAWVAARPHSSHPRSHRIGDQLTPIDHGVELWGTWVRLPTIFEGGYHRSLGRVGSPWASC
jgi:hypothetical protein